MAEEEDFGELLGLEEGETLEMKKDGETIEAPPEPAPETKEKKPANNPPAGKKPAGGKKKKGKAVDLDFGGGQDDGPQDDEAATKQEMEARKEQAKEAAAIMGLDIKKSIDSVELKTLDDYNTFAQLIWVKLSADGTRSQIVEFMGQMLKSMEEDVTSEDYSKLQSKLTVLFNNKLKAEKGKDNKKKNTKPSLNRGRPGRNEHYEMYEIEGQEGTDDYGGYDEIDFM